ncbi:septin-7-like [Zophobas morio]|jgi:septin family protein|uniref:septin-7-like n=1 Tax=Zophobas morio TaxID=2755281 RepID=UPI003083ADE0
MSNLGFANLPAQIHRKSVKKGFEFSLMIMGEAGLGKTTFVNSLFQQNFGEDKEYKTAEQRMEPNSSIRVVERELLDQQVKLKLTILDIVGFADAVDNTNTWSPAYEYIVRKLDEYLEQEGKVKRSKIVDNRVDALCYFISPNSNGLRPLDVTALKKLHNLVNIIPLIAKADTLTKSEIGALKHKVMEDIFKHNIKIYSMPFDSDDDDVSTTSANVPMPYAVVSSNSKIRVGGKEVYGRQYTWGAVEIENDEHCDFNTVRNILVRHGLHDLKERTNDLYEDYRAFKLNTAE